MVKAGLQRQDGGWGWRRRRTDLLKAWFKAAVTVEEGEKKKSHCLPGAPRELSEIRVPAIDS